MTMPSLLRCFQMYNQGMNQIIIQSSNNEELLRIIEYIQTSYVPNTIVIILNKSDHKLLQYNKQLSSFVIENNEKTKIFLCQNFQCQLPAISLDEFKNKFDPLILRNQ